MSDLHARAASPVRGVTIDPPASLDLDDAVWLNTEGGTRRISISIADVAAAVRDGSRLDAEARQRGFTRYFANGNAPMLPRSLAEDRLSLLPGEPRHVITLELDLDDRLAPSNIVLRRARLVSEAKLSYPRVAEIVQSREYAGPHADLKPMLDGLAALASCLMEARRKRGELAIYDLTSGWAATEEGRLRRLSRDEANIAYIIVQELMILANRTVAETLVHRDVPALYRNHVARVAAPDRAHLLEDIRGAIHRPDLFDVETLRRRLNLILARARYGPELRGHFGLNLPAYVHFTSPIRRYADLVNHRVVAALLDEEPPPYTHEELARIGAHLNELTDEEERRAVERYKRRAQEEIEQLTVSGEDSLRDLDERRVYQVLETAAAAGDAPEPVVRAIESRFKEERISIKEAFFLLYQSDATQASWARLRRRAAEWLADKPHHAPNLLSIGMNLQTWGEARLDTEGGAGSADFTCIAAVERQGRMVDSGVRWGGSKKVAQQRAALALCFRLAAEPVPEFLERQWAPQPAADAPARKTAPEKGPAGQPRKKGHTIPWDKIQAQQDQGNWVGALNIACSAPSQQKPRTLYTDLPDSTAACAL